MPGYGISTINHWGNKDYDIKAFSCDIVIVLIHGKVQLRPAIKEYCI